MSVTVEDRRSRLRSALSAALALLLLVPVAVLFRQVWQPAADDIATAERERRGVEYLSGLAQLLAATNQAQGAALRGAPAPPELAGAVRRAADIDERLGAEFGARERWATLRAQIERLPRAAAAGQELAAYTAYVQVSDLLLGLYRTVRDGSGLSRDDRADTFYLQQAIGTGLPASTVQAARVADLTTLAPRVKRDRQAGLAIDLGVAVDQVTDAVGVMTTDLQAAADDTRSTTLSSGVLSGIDRFRRGVDGIVQGGSAVLKAAAAPGAAQQPAPNAETVAAGLALLAGLRTDMLTAATDLSTAVLRELDTLLANRVDDLRNRQRAALLAVAAAVLLALAAVLAPLVGRTRRRGAGSSGTVFAGARAPAMPDPGPARRRDDVLTGAARRHGDDGATAHWERPDVLR